MWGQATKIPGERVFQTGFWIYFEGRAGKSADESDMWSEKTRGIKDDSWIFGLSNYKNADAISWDE